MIYIKRDANLIPQEVLDVALRAQQELEQLPECERKNFIKKKSHIWRAFGKYLSRMSYGKCWYSESKDAGAKYDVDHFRPKSEAKRTEEITDEEGYAWLAFDWTNYRLSAQNSNRLTKDEENAITVGKGSWFPLLENSSKANWNDRRIENEAPILLDPVVKDDLSFIDFDERGRFVPNKFCVGTPAHRIKMSAIVYGLNLEQMREIRFAAMMEAKNLLETIQQSAEDLNPLGDKASMKSIQRQINQLKEKTRADAAFSLAVRVQLQKLGAPDLFIDRTIDAT
ncbi:hypothetical protein [Vibrio parahaemolyticus]|uniref:hypothetical protein n=1 Tax=Vibrio parahaemolyticus TaxID=670 RepID=UPI00111CF4F3|nr:hypothetical protein [Vibrio parahaemolyticus]ELP6988602.1 hypothetical protein [Vibrio vulnificus]MCZ5870529.1 hypothetical protein [Vibrio parahaemolyticus]MCZ5900922.1 hypothetical protein [Vibrio parahaemolyticus]MCZ6021905.1 hypothetical protein [Vibrio parahaemolyticus]MCZ6309219.1 hypothetical protein [Vibrio parahaemolyticus]